MVGCCVLNLGVFVSVPVSNAQRSAKKANDRMEWV